MNLLPPAVELPHDGEHEVMLRDKDGVPVAYGWAEKGEHYIVFPELATFRFRPGSEEFEAVPHGLAKRDEILDVFYTSVVPLAVQAGGREVVHASAVLVRRRGVVGFTALSETGKSTVAYGLSRRGHRLWADDAVAFDTGSAGPVRSHPLPFDLHLRPEAAAYFGAGPASAAGADPEQPEPLGVIFVLERTESHEPVADEVVRVTGSEALSALLPHAYRLTVTDRDRVERTMRSYLDLVARVPVVRLRFVPGFDRFPRLLDRIEAAVGDIL